jgi:beta-galactosidase/beta-glucuronidase
MQNFGSDAAPAERFLASKQDGTYPRPQLVRGTWVDLSGAWGFRFDDSDRGETEHWYDGQPFGDSIVVPFPPESRASGVADTGFHRVIWYRRELTSDDLGEIGFGESAPRLILHFGAVDYRARVWLNGQYLGEHEGGHTPFQFNATAALDFSRETQVIVVRAEDDPFDVTQPRGKQDWMREPHAVWYDRTSGIWQPVWLEAVPEVAVRSLSWSTDITAGTVTATVALASPPPPEATLELELSFDGRSLAWGTTRLNAVETRITLDLAGQRNGQDYEHLLWSPETPRLVDATVVVRTAGSVDSVRSYFGIRSAAVERGRFLLNNRPFFVRSVLSQGFWPETHLATPSARALRDEVQLIKDLGFTAARIHQKIEDPRFLFWADRLGLLVWEEMPSAFEFSSTAARRVVAEWTAAVERDRSHPSIVTWVPLNESWGVQHIAHDARMMAHARSLVELTRALDGTRPVISNDGWEHVDSDIWSIHDYEESAPVVAARYEDETARTALLTAMGPAGRRILLDSAVDTGQPVMLTEFGGIRFTPGDADSGAWGYSVATSANDFRNRLQSLVAAVQSSEFLAGFCYTQLTDTQQEANGLVDAQRMPKLPLEELAAIIRGGER